jgi:hypothetical protein
MVWVNVALFVSAISKIHTADIASVVSPYCQGGISDEALVNEIFVISGVSYTDGAFSSLTAMALFPTVPNGESCATPH